MASLFQKVFFSFKKLPGIGSRAAEKLTFHLLTMKEEEVALFAEALLEYRQKTKPCPDCGLPTEGKFCKICRDSTRDHSVICLVEKSLDAFTLEKAGVYRGVYHVLGGKLSPLNGIDEKKLEIEKLYHRFNQGTINEVIIALGPGVESEVAVKIIKRGSPISDSIKWSRLAVGIPTGSGLEHIDGDTIKSSLDNRTTLPNS